MLRMTLFATVLVSAFSPVLAQSQDGFRQPQVDFDRVDVNGDDVISRAEFRNLKLARWTQIDRNSDGYLSEEDFPASALRRARTQLAVIADLDTDGDGRISRDEFLDGPTPMFNHADRNTDGVVARSEVEEQAS